MGRRGRRPRRQPRLRRGLQRRRGAGGARRHRAPQPGLRAARRRARDARGARPRAAGGAARAAAGRPRRHGAALGAPAAGDARRARARSRCTRRCCRGRCATGSSPTGRSARAPSAGRSGRASRRRPPSLRRLGPFDAAVHLFAEDMELCLRARAEGRPTVLHPDLRIRHAGGHATLRAGEPLDLLARRRRAVVAATRGRRAQRLDDLAQAVTFATRAAAHAALGGDARRPARQLAALARARAAHARAPREARAADPPDRRAGRGGARPARLEPRARAAGRCSRARRAGSRTRRRPPGTSWRRCPRARCSGAGAAAVRRSTSPASLATSRGSPPPTAPAWWSPRGCGRCSRPPRRGRGRRSSPCTTTSPACPCRSATPPSRPPARSRRGSSGPHAPAGCRAAAAPGAAASR